MHRFATETRYRCRDAKRLVEVWLSKGCNIDTMRNEKCRPSSVNVDQHRWEVSPVQRVIQVEYHQLVRYIVLMTEVNTRASPHRRPHDSAEFVGNAVVNELAHDAGAHA